MGDGQGVFRALLCSRHLSSCRAAQRCSVVELGELEPDPGGKHKRAKRAGTALIGAWEENVPEGGKNRAVSACNPVPTKMEITAFSEENQQNLSPADPVQDNSEKALYTERE